MFFSRRSTVLLTTLLLGSTACQGSETQANAVPDVASMLISDSRGVPVPVVEVTGMDYAFSAPLEIGAGWTTLRFMNHGPEPHHLSLMRLENGSTVADLMNALRERRPLTGIATAVGGPNAPMPGADAYATLHLEAGDYAMLCFIPSPDGVLHLQKGMVKPITVTGETSGAGEPPADVHIRFSDYEFDLSGEILSGLRTIRVSTDLNATEPHEVVLARLSPGSTAEDLNDWIHSMRGPPPAEFIGGITAIDPGGSALFTAHFTPGEYALICPLPSSKDGEPHSMKGMIQQFTVR